MIATEEIPNLFTAFRTRWRERDDRIDIIDAVVSGDWSILGPDDEKLENRSPNLIQVALEDTAEAASAVPSVKVTPSTGSELAKKKANAMTQMALAYMDQSQIELLLLKSFMDQAAFGFYVWVVSIDKESGSPVIEWRDPRTCFPEHGYATMDSVRTCLFARDLYFRQLPGPWKAKLKDHFDAQPDYVRFQANYNDVKVTLIEAYDEDEILVCGVYQTSSYSTAGQPGQQYQPVELERTKTVGKICPVVIGQRPTLDSEPRGQFDQVVGVLQAHIRLMGMVLDYSDQAVYSDLWVKDLIGQLPYGGGSVIQLGPNGSIGRVQPAVSSLQVQESLDDLVNNIHLGGRWPKSRPGEIDQSIASAKYLEASAGMMNTVIRTMHLVNKRALEQALRICFRQDEIAGRDTRMISGVLKNQQFLEVFDKKLIDTKARLKVDYGIGLGRDPAQTMVLGIQGMQTGLFSKEFVQENFEGLTDVAGERQRLDVEMLKDMAFAKIQQGVQDGTIPAGALVEIARKRAKGEDMFDVFEEYIVKPAEAQQAQMVQPGLPGAEPMMPGANPAEQGMMQPPSAPPPEGLLGALMGGGKAPVKTIARNSVPLGGGSFMGVQSGG